jgi:hypothetical protein
MNRAQRRQAEKVNGDSWSISNVQKPTESDLFLHLDASNTDPNTNRYIVHPGTKGACVWRKVNGNAFIDDIKRKEKKQFYLVNIFDVIK